MNLAILNKSTLVTDDQADKMADAVQIQLAVHVAPTWDRMPPVVKFYAKDSDVPVDACILCIKDNISEPGALGFHTEGPDGSYWSDIAASPVLDNGGGVLDKGNSGYSVASVLSHEAIELFCDASVNDWCDGPSTQMGSCYAKEACDPVEGDCYGVTLPDETVVFVSNFVGPRYFDLMAPAGSDFDYCNTVTKPFELAPGGYYVVRNAPGSEHEMFAALMPPEWRMAMKKGRTALRKSRR